ncbi:MAG: phosphatase PAP2 family protein [Magnetospirillum sp.]|nr:MAG: phosphatase PAP2 family protein [Magnetospirillum sp.]
MTASKAHFIRFTIAMAAAISLSLTFADLPVARYFHSIGDGWLARLAAATTDGGLAVWYLVGAAALFLLFRFVLQRRREAMMAAFVFAAVAASGIITDVLKVAFGRARPKLLFRDDIYGFHGFKFGAVWNSFPSGHSTTVAAMTVALCLLAPRWRLAIIPLGTALVATRVITTAHYLSDALFGTYVGTTTAFWVYHHFRRRGLLACPALTRGEKS